MQNLSHNMSSCRTAFIAVCFIIFGSLTAFAQEQNVPDKDFVEAKINNSPTLTVPKEAVDEKLGGVVSVRITIDKNGIVKNADEALGPDWVCPDVETPAVIAMRDAARAAARNATFTPATRKGKPVEATIYLNFDFPKPKPDTTVTGVRAAENSGGSDSGASANTSAARLPKLVSGGVLNGKAVFLAKPEYPPAAHAVRAAGSVTVKILIYDDGSVFSAEPVDGHPLLRSAGRVAACKSRFSPVLLMGNPVRVSGVLTYNFTP